MKFSSTNWGANCITEAPFGGYLGANCNTELHFGGYWGTNCITEVPFSWYWRSLRRFLGAIEVAIVLLRCLFSVRGITEASILFPRGLWGAWGENCMLRWLLGPTGMAILLLKSLLGDTGAPIVIMRWLLRATEAWIVLLRHLLGLPRRE